MDSQHPNTKRKRASSSPPALTPEKRAQDVRDFDRTPPSAKEDETQPPGSDAYRNPVPKRQKLDSAVDSRSDEHDSDNQSVPSSAIPEVEDLGAITESHEDFVLHVSDIVREDDPDSISPGEEQDENPSANSVEDARPGIPDGSDVNNVNFHLGAVTSNNLMGLNAPEAEEFVRELRTMFEENREDDEPAQEDNYDDDFWARPDTRTTWQDYLDLGREPEADERDDSLALVLMQILLEYMFTHY